MAFTPVLEQFIEVEQAENQADASFTLTDPGAGKLLVIGCAVRNTVTEGDVTATDFTAAANVIEGQVIKLLYKLSVGGETSITLSTNTVSSTKGAWLAVFSAGTGWIWSVSPLDKTATAASGAGDVTSQSTGTTATLAQADELAVALLGIRRTADATSVHAADNSFTLEGVAQPTAGAQMGEAGMAYRVLAATTGITTTFTWTTAYRAGGVIATFMAEETGAAPAFDLDRIERRYLRGVGRGILRGAA